MPDAPRRQVDRELNLRRRGRLHELRWFFRCAGLSLFFTFASNSARRGLADTTVLLVESRRDRQVNVELAGSGRREDAEESEENKEKEEIALRDVFLRPTEKDANEEEVEKKLQERRLVPTSFATIPGALVGFWRWHMARILVPMAPEVAKWWNEGADNVFLIRLLLCSSGEPHVHIQVIGSNPLRLPDGSEVHGIHAVVSLPPGIVLSGCYLDWVSVSIRPTSLTGVVPERALRLVCPVLPSGSGFPAKVVRTFFRLFLPRGIGTGAVHLLPARRSPVSLLLLVFMGTFASTGIVLILAVLLKARIARLMLRRSRLQELRRLRQDAAPVDWAYCEDDPCCICLGDLVQHGRGDEEPLVLLPCRHTLHVNCFGDWVAAARYPSRRLFCPMCTRRVSSLARLDVAAPHSGNLETQPSRPGEEPHADVVVVS